MGLTEEQRKLLVSNHQMPMHLFVWCRAMYDSDCLTRVQYNTVKKLLDMTHREKCNYVIIEDRLVLGSKRRKLFEKTRRGWIQRKIRKIKAT
jgi:hypothetical protein